MIDKNELEEAYSEWDQLGCGRMHISPTAPIQTAWDHMVRILFKPFEFKKWFLLGFCAFLAQCSETIQRVSGDGSTSFDLLEVFPVAIMQWIESNIALVVVAGVVVVLLVVWLSSRGRFMLLDGIVKNRGAVSEPWSEYKTEGNSFFLFSVVVGLIMIVGLIITAGVPIFVALPDIQSNTFGGFAIAAIVLAFCLFLPSLIACIAFKFFVNWFIVPTMYLKRVRAVEGMQVAWSTLCKGHVGTGIVLFLMMCLLLIAAAMIMTITCCCCFCTILPYISSVVYLPITVFFVCYALCYIQQFGKEWQFNLYGTSNCSFCGYLREGLKDLQRCPECGLEPSRNY